MPHFVPYTVLPEPELEFGRSSGGWPVCSDPQYGLAEYGPYSSRLEHRRHPKRVRVFPICARSDWDEVLGVLQHLDDFTRVEGASSYARVDFLGFSRVFKTEFRVEASAAHEQCIDDGLFDIALSKDSPAEGYREVIRIIKEAGDAIGELQGEDVVVVYLPSDIVKKFRRFDASFKPIKKRKASTIMEVTPQMLLFPDLSDDMDDEGGETLYNDLRRSIKAMFMRQGVAVQLITDNFLAEQDTQPRAGKFWNISASIFAKAGGIPWRLSVYDDVAYCGIRFGVAHHGTGRSIYVGLAHLTNAKGELVALRAGDATKGRAKSEAGYYLTRQQAVELMRNAIQDYELVTGRLPERVVVHKSSPFRDDEIQGVRDAAAGIADTELVYIRSKSSVRLVPERGQPADRGSVVPSSPGSALLYTSGYVPALKKYRGRHVPSPIELVQFQTSRTMREMAEDVLKLSKMNWNTTLIDKREICTFVNATEMIGMMKELGEDESLHPNIRYYI